MAEQTYILLKKTSGIMFYLWIEDSRSKDFLGLPCKKDMPRFSIPIGHHNIRLFIFFTGDLKGGTLKDA